MSGRDDEPWGLGRREIKLIIPAIVECLVRDEESMELLLAAIRSRLLAEVRTIPLGLRGVEREIDLRKDRKDQEEEEGPKKEEITTVRDEIPGVVCSVRLFVLEICLADDNSVTTNSELYEAYVRFCVRRNLKIVSGRLFTQKFNWEMPSARRGRASNYRYVCVKLLEVG